MLVMRRSYSDSKVWDYICLGEGDGCSGGTGGYVCMQCDTLHVTLYSYINSLQQPW